VSEPGRDDLDVARLYVALGRLTRAVRRDSSEALVGHGALSALATLVTEGPQRAGALAETEGVTAPAMTRILNSLDELGYVVRRPDPADRRASVVDATDRGRELVTSGRALRLRALQDRLGRLPDDERVALLAALPVLEKLGDA
jgi:DNA-binding MarR family transcriptional regulator